MSKRGRRRYDGLKVCLWHKADLGSAGNDVRYLAQCGLGCVEVRDLERSPRFQEWMSTADSLLRYQFLLPQLRVRRWNRQASLRVWCSPAANRAAWAAVINASRRSPGSPFLPMSLRGFKPQVAALAINANHGPSRFAIGLPIIADRIAGHAGPLAGLHAALAWAKEQDTGIRYVVSVACDRRPCLTISSSASSLRWRRQAANVAWRARGRACIR